MDKQEELEMLQEECKRVKDEFDRLQREIEDPNSKYNAHRWVMNYLLAFGGRRLA